MLILILTLTTREIVVGEPMSYTIKQKLIGVEGESQGWACSELVNLLFANREISPFYEPFYGKVVFRESRAFLRNKSFLY